MGDFTDGMLDGTFCMQCGEVIAMPSADDPDVLEPLGYPTMCDGCRSMDLERWPNESDEDYFLRVDANAREWSDREAASWLMEVQVAAEDALREAAEYGEAGEISEAEKAEVLRRVELRAVTAAIRTRCENYKDEDVREWFKDVFSELSRIMSSRFYGKRVVVKMVEVDDEEGED